MNGSIQKAVAACRAASRTCDEELTRLENSTEYWEIGAGPLPVTCVSRRIIVGCTEHRGIPGHGAGGRITINPNDFPDAQRALGIAVNFNVVIPHEAAHANGCVGLAAERCAITVENRARAAMGHGLRPVP